MTLFLLPNLFEYDPLKVDFLPAILQEVVGKLDGLLCENEKNGRRYLSYFRKHLKRQVHQIPIALFNKKTSQKELDFLFEPMCQGRDWGYVTDCGLCVIADPGAPLVKKAFQCNIDVVPIQGPCAITMALQLSTFSGNRFSFFGYLDKQSEIRKKQIQMLEKRSYQNDEVIICMETPFRNNQLLDELIHYLSPSTTLCIASHLMNKDQLVITKRLKDLSRSLPIDLKDKPTLFLFKA
jgi:16S rRNA (cytidine1402-2'-O)-methyltransferase